MAARPASASRQASPIVAFSQRDPRWTDVRLGAPGAGGHGLTIGQAGCLLCAAASMLATWGWDTDPLRLNLFLASHEGFVDGNLLVFGVLDGQWCRFLELIRCERRPAPVDRLLGALGGGAGVLACVDWAGGREHWVWLVELGERSGWVVDPWRPPGDALQPLELHYAQGWNPWRGIYAAAIFSRLARRREVTWIGSIDRYQETICCRRAAD